MDNLTPCISLIFGLIAFLTVFTFYKAAGSEKRAGVFLLLLVLVQSCLASGFFKFTDTVSSRMLWMVVPPVLLGAWLFLARPGKMLLDGMDMHLLTVIHVVRAPMEVIMHLLFICQVLPGEITLGGGNFDILAGLTAPVVYYFGILKGNFKWPLLISWNLACLGSLASLATKCLLPAPAFSQAGVPVEGTSLISFPFVLLPAVIVPVLACAHLAMIRHLLLAHRAQLKMPFSHRQLFRQLMIKTFLSHAKHQN